MKLPYPIPTKGKVDVFVPPGKDIRHHQSIRIIARIVRPQHGASPSHWVSFLVAISPFIAFVDSQRVPHNKHPKNDNGG